MTSSKLTPLKTSALICAAAVLMTGPLTSIAVAHGHHHHRHGLRIFVGVFTGMATAAPATS
jgi:hypothetical protein